MWNHLATLKQEICDLFFNLLVGHLEEKNWMRKMDEIFNLSRKEEYEILNDESCNS